jgi:hypothetical protein
MSDICKTNQRFVRVCSSIVYNTGMKLVDFGVTICSLGTWLADRSGLWKPPDKRA